MSGDSRNVLSTFREWSDIFMTVSTGEAQYLKFHSSSICSFQETSTVSYNRLNHQDFTVNIKLKNPQSSQKKVVLRIFLGISEAGYEIGLIIFW